MSNESVFPHPAPRNAAGEVKGLSTPGMSLRDYFAGQALAGVMNGLTVEIDPRIVAHDAYLAADAMLEERLRTLRSEQ